MTLFEIDNSENQIWSIVYIEEVNAIGRYQGILRDYSFLVGEIEWSNIMNSKKKTHQNYSQLVFEINKLTMSIDERNKRYEYLYNRICEMIDINKEQAEAYAQRAKHQKEKILEELKKKTTLELKLQDTPRTWIV